MSTVPPSGPSRRHFIGIAAAVARKLSMLSVGSSAWYLSGARDAAANGYERERHHQLVRRAARGQPRTWVSIRLRYCSVE